jgi:FkbM family methyltransferase
VDMSFIENKGLLRYLADQHTRHSCQTSWWDFNSQLAKESVSSLKLRLENSEEFGIGEIENILFSYRDMGAVNTLDLFGLDELIMFAFYWKSRAKYKRVVDMGANVGLHTVVLNQLGYEVKSYEPDPSHVVDLVKNLRLNAMSVEGISQEAVTTDGTKVEFTRVVGNTTGSHVSGAKEDPYGELETFDVESAPISEVIQNADLVKMDVEGLEADLLSVVTKDEFDTVDFMIEIGSPKNATQIFNHLRGMGVNAFSQKNNWRKVESVADLPMKHQEGSCFISSAHEMEWSE